MNGRIYDGLLGRFLSADVMVQFPDSLQSYNRYSYVRNNPLSLVDPTGWWELKIFGLRFSNDGTGYAAQARKKAVEVVKNGSMENFKANSVAVAKSVDRDFQEGGVFLLLAKYTGLPAGGMAGPGLRLAGVGEAVVATDTVQAAANAIAGTAAVANMASGDIKPADGAQISEKPPLKEGETGKYGELQSRSKPGDKLDIHESPSNKANEKAFIEKYRKENGGADPSPAEIAQYRKDNPSVAIRRETHLETDTYAGRNTATKSSTDATDLEAAAQRGADDLIQAGNKTGVDLSKSAQELLELQKKRGGG